MSCGAKTRLAGIALLAGLILAVSGCAVAPATAQRAANPTVVIVQYVTQVVATVTPAPPRHRYPADPKDAASFYGLRPVFGGMHYPVSGCQVASRLNIGDVAFVAVGSEQFGIHFSKDVGFSPITRKLTPGELLYILDGPTCNRNGLVWQVLADADDAMGYVIDGNGETYWLLPYGQTYDAKEIRDRVKSRTSRSRFQPFLRRFSHIQASRTPIPAPSATAATLRRLKAQGGAEAVAGYRPSIQMFRENPAPGGGGSSPTH